jgi:hypothetical protein
MSVLKPKIMSQSLPAVLLLLFTSISQICCEKLAIAKVMVPIE